MPASIKVEGLSKVYSLGQIGTGTISRDLERFWKMKVRGKEDPFLKIGESNDRSTKGSSNIVYSLRDLNFTIQQGEAVGIIGKNGAGKSTLLKILSRVTSPTTGTVKVKGRIASLLEVGTGFHPELSGKENIYLNGAIMGMQKSEIKQKLDEIIDFSGVERYIDTPVKRYSSGMYVRLAFAVAAHLESEILIVDEVLAVGDAEFQKKCLGKMNDVSRGEGRTVLFVSHNMGVISQLCKTAILLHKGEISINGKVTDVVQKYINDNNSIESSFYVNEELNRKHIYVKSVELRNLKNEIADNFTVDENIVILIKVAYNKLYPCPHISITIQNSMGDYLSTFVENLQEHTLNDAGEYILKIKLQSNVIAPNAYFVRVALFLPMGEVYDILEMICPFRIIDSGSKMAMFEGFNYGNFILGYELI